MDYKRSRLREELYEKLSMLNTHPTAQELYEMVRTDFPKVSLATVYRNLKILVDLEEIVRVEIPGDSERYETRLDNHYHMICEGCGSVMDIPLEIETSLNSRVEAITPYKVSRHRILFYGLCERCS